MCTGRVNNNKNVIIRIDAYFIVIIISCLSSKICRYRFRDGTAIAKGTNVFKTKEAI